MPQELIGSCSGTTVRFIGRRERTEGLPKDASVGDCCIYNNKIYIYYADSWSIISNDSCYGNTKKEQFKKIHHRFKCKYCGAPGQIDVCSYCGNTE